MNQRELARECGLSPAYVANLERNTSEPPPMNTCRALARALGASFEDVWQTAFKARLRKWLKREGFRQIPEHELVEIARRITATSH